MAADAEDLGTDSLAPYGFVRGPDSLELFAEYGDGLFAGALVAGFYGTTYFHCDERAIAIVIRSMAPRDVRDWMSSVLRRSSGTAEVALAFVEAVREAYPDYALSVVGHSAAGAVASYVAAEQNLPSVVFNATRTDFAQTNDGAEQLVVTVSGDVFSDPEAAPAAGVMAVPQAIVANPGRIAGVELRIDPVGEYRFLWELHYIDVIIDELNWILGREAPGR